MSLLLEDLVTPISIEDLGLAYRKAKVDLYYSTNPSLFQIADYEDNLQSNLNDLLELLNGVDDSWIESPDFLGDWILIPKSIHFDFENKTEGLICASPDDEWSELTSEDKKPTAEFRVMARCSMNFHVLSAL